MRAAEAVNLISHYTACLIAVIGSSFPGGAAEAARSPDPTLPSGVRRVLYYYHQEDGSCVSQRPIIPANRRRHNSNFSFLLLRHNQVARESNAAKR